MLLLKKIDLCDFNRKYTLIIVNKGIFSLISGGCQSDESKKYVRDNLVRVKQTASMSVTMFLLHPVLLLLCLAMRCNSEEVENLKISSSLETLLYHHHYHTQQKTQFHNRIHRTFTHSYAASS